MRTLGKFKLLAVSALIVLGMSSCLKNSDPDFGIGISPCFILQEGTNNFRPVMTVYSLSLEPMQNVSVKYQPAHDSLNMGTLYSFSPVDQSKTTWWLSPTYGSGSSKNIPNGIFNVQASNLEGKVSLLPVTVDIDKKLEVINIKKLTYTASNGVSAEWEKVENATAYVMLYKFENQKEWRPVAWREGNSPSLTSGTFNDSYIKKGDVIDVTVGTIYNGNPNKSISLIALGGNQLRISWGTDTPSAE